MGRALGLCALWVIGCGSPVVKTLPVPGEIIGRVEISADVPATGCQVLLEGTPLGARCDETGTFDIKKVPPGRWDLRVISDARAVSLPSRRLAAGSNPGQVSDLGPVRLAKPGSIGGRVLGGNNLPLAIVAVPAIGAVTAPNDNGGYLLEGVSPGIHEVVLITADGTVVRDAVNVQPGKVTVGADFDASRLMGATVAVVGRAGRNDAADGDNGDITVELVESLDGKVIDSVKSQADGSFSLAARQGTYLVRARAADGKSSAIIPSLVVRGQADLILSSALVLQAPAGDLDGDGIPDDKDVDQDGDGVLDATDAFPRDPAESKDTDGDGVGDRADLRSKGGTGVDNKKETPDTDGDGKLDFEDNCPMVANADQKDVDSDEVGDACDNCKFVPNTDQADSVMNGIGDLCRSCKLNTDCGSGKICQFGQCVDCLTNAQCGDKVCDQGKCVACTSTSQCSGQTLCATGRCVQCVATADCPAGQACVANTCFAQCTVDANCPGAFCVMGACVACRGNADCGGTKWCDNGTCRDQCVGDGDCTNGRKCDAVTKTCVLPCSAMCPTGQACDGAMVCRPLCDGSRPCAVGQICTPQSLCQPECSITADCAGKPFTTCSGGQCVPSGACAYDGDCAAAQMCTAGACINRPTMLVAGKGYLCTAACDCRMGERCEQHMDGMKYCVAEPKPTRFIQSAVCAMPPCDGSSPQKANNDSRAVIEAAVANDVVALKAGDSFAPTTPYAINAGDVTVSGGYTECAPNRWVRDGALRSTLAGANSPGLFSVTASGAAPKSNVVIRNFDLSSTNPGATQYWYINALFTPNLVVEKVTCTFPTISNLIYGVNVNEGANLRVSDVDSPGISGGASAVSVLVRLHRSSGLVERVHMGTVTGVDYFDMVSVSSTLGAMTIRDCTADRLDSLRGAGIWVGDSATSEPLTVTNNALAFQAALATASGGTEWSGFYFRNVPTLVSSGNTVDGRGLTDSGAARVTTGHHGFHFVNTSGTSTNDTVYFATKNSPLYVYGFRVDGPGSTLTIDGGRTSGGGAPELYPMLTTPNSSGFLTIRNSVFSAGDPQIRADALLLDAGNFLVTDSSFTVTDPTNIAGGGTNGQCHGVFVLTGAVGRIERSQFRSCDSNTNNHVYGARIRGGTQVELYDNWILAGATTGSGFISYGLWFEAAGGTLSQTFATGNAIDGGGSLGIGTSYGIDVGNFSGFMFTSNLIDGGRANTHHPYRAGTGNNVASFRNNYFQYSAPGTGEPGDTTMTGSVGNPDQNGNITGDHVRCTDVTVPQPTYKIAAGSPCVNAGVAGTRQDLSPITEDIEKRVRVQGAAADIGCYEKQ